MNGRAAGLPASARRVAGASEARALVAEVLAALDALDRVLTQETGLMASGRIREALGLAEAKQERSGAYMRLLESVKANAVALARFAPEGVERLKVRHGEFTQGVKLNQTVIATVRSVSETLLRSLQEEATASRRLTVYGPGAAPSRAAAGAGALALSLRL